MEKLRDNLLFQPKQSRSSWFSFVSFLRYYLILMNLKKHLLFLGERDNELLAEMLDEEVDDVESAERQSEFKFDFFRL